MADSDYSLQENQAESVQPDKPVSRKKYFKHWKTVNIWLFALTAFPLGVSLIGVLGISGKLFLIAAAANLLLGKVHQIYIEKDKLQSLLLPLRVIAVASVILFYLPCLILTGSTANKMLYPVKRYLYTKGVSAYGSVLPKTLPKQCDGYFFFTQVQAVAQDYHPSSYLAFYTDTATMQKYAETFGGTKTQTQRSEENADFKYPPEIPGHVISTINPAEDLQGAVIYTLDDNYYSKGLILDYDSGYVIFWT